MPTNRNIFSGRVISAQYKGADDPKKCILNVTISIVTGEKKKEGDAFPPSLMLQFSLFGNYATSMSELITAGRRLIVDGKMGVPYLYQKDNELKCVMKLNEASVEMTGEMPDTDVAPTTNAPAEAKTTSKKKQPPKDEFGELEDLNFDL